MYKGATTTHADPTMQRCADPTRCLKIFFSALQSHRKKVSVFFLQICELYLIIYFDQYKLSPVLQKATQYK